MAATVFFSYSHADEALRDQLEKQLAALKRQGLIETWHDRRIEAGADFAGKIGNHVDNDDIILLLVSPDFIASDYCYDIEMTRAMERHEAGEAVVIPVILRACAWHETPFGKLNATPRDGKPITQLPDRDQAFLEVAQAIQAVASRLSTKAPPQTNTTSHRLNTNVAAGPRSSNLALAKSFTERDKERFKRESFEFMALFFENSLDELAKRNDGIEGDFRRIDADRFEAVIYKHGKSASHCTISLADRTFFGGITYSPSKGSGGISESLGVEADSDSLFLRSTLGISVMASGKASVKLSQAGAAELYWGLFIGPLQSR